MTQGAARATFHMGHVEAAPQDAGITCRPGKEPLLAFEVLDSNGIIVLKHLNLSQSFHNLSPCSLGRARPDKGSSQATAADRPLGFLTQVSRVSSSRRCSSFKMPISLKDSKAYRADERHGHTLLTEKQRQAIFRASLPSTNDGAASKSRHAQPHHRSRLGVRRFLKNQIFFLIFALMHGVFSLYIKSRQAWHAVRYQVSSVLYYHHGTPEYIRRDVTSLSKKPNHLSAILKTEPNHKPKADLDRLIDETAELATWSACAEIPTLSIYEKTGILKKNMPRVYEAVMQKFAFYFGEEHPTLSVMAPHKDDLPLAPEESKHGHLKLHLISYQDGRDSIVDLTRTLADMSQKGKISPQDISLELVDAELSDGIMPEPDLLILFGPYIELSGYPPWQIRLTEIFCLQDNESFGYQVFLKALRNFARAQMRHGR